MFSQQLKRIFERHGKAFSIICFCVFSVIIIGSGAAQTIRKISVEREILASLNSAAEQDNIKVNVRGAVNNADVYELPRGSRVSDAVSAAGGLSDNAARNHTNLADFVEDGDDIYIPSADAQTKNNDGRININTASLSELKSLSGVGDVTAQKIIDYREANGSFTSISQLKNIEGIGDKTFENIKEFVALE